MRGRPRRASPAPSPPKTHQEQQEPRDPELRVFPHELREGDVIGGAVGEGTVVLTPSVYLQGRGVSVRLRQSNGQERVLDFAAHEKVAVWRPRDAGQAG